MQKLIGGGRFATIKAIFLVAIIGLITSLSITTTNAIAQSQVNGIDFKPDKIQVAINEETGEATCDPFEFVNNTSDSYLFEKSELTLTDDAKAVSSEND